MKAPHFVFTFVFALLWVACSNPPTDNAASASDDGSAATSAAFDAFFNDVINGHNTARLEEVIHPDFHSHHYPMPPGSDKAGFIQGMTNMLAAFPDMNVKVNDQFVKGDKVFSYFAWTGTQQGAFMGVPPTGKKVMVEGMDIWRVQDGKLIENWVIMDGMGLMMQLGAIPPPAPASQVAEQK